ncbi:hypothetical protein GALMADRAFT_237602 [Galerina marginata CBS 339.88]|uniref:Uncharacterized protein n=1 Tax=Galerina marginata (strain CBS 339.88) TaxID=685588 RepID=A0A067TTN3_GALM3|nr:hypothetical protein GALMADRAFT_237602 [Galerina marginata CBS 339.88]
MPWDDFLPSNDRLARYRRMFFRLLDIPISVFQIDAMKWTVSSILLLSVIYTYSIKNLTQGVVDESDLKPRTYHLARAKRQISAQKAQLELEEKRRRIYESRSFRFRDLPPEVCLVVLAYCADWPGTYQSLVRVSRDCQRLTFHACLPRIPVTLISPEQVHSFDQFLQARPKLACLVHHMWMTPLKEELLDTSIAIVQKCNNLRSLASNAFIVQESITLHKDRLSHGNCKDLTLLSTRTESWTSLLNTSNGSAFFRQLTHLRLIGDRIPRDLPLPSLTHFSYGSSGSDMSETKASIGLSMVEDKMAYPMLYTVILTRPRTSAGGLRISRAVAKTRVFIFELPPKRTELEIWCDNASQRGMWELCADPPAFVTG